MEENLVSIVVPVYNCEQFIDRTIKTVKEQIYKNWELILVNDCSVDDSKKIIEKYLEKEKRIQLIDLKENLGAAVARNIGIKQAKGKYIAFLDSDDLWDKEKLKKQIKFMEENKYEFTYTGYEFADADGKKTGKVVNVPEKLKYKQALKNTTIFTSTVVFDVEKLGKELIQMPNIASEDTATWWKVLRNGYEAYGLDEILSCYRRTKGSLSSNKLVAIKRIWNLYRRYEKKNIIISLYCLFFWAINAVKRRI